MATPLAERFDSVLESCCSKLGVTLRPEQTEAVRSVAMGKDVFVSLPTGAGKSVCYAILPMVFDSLRNVEGSITLVVSPLLALMKNQVEILNSRGIRAAYVGSDQGSRDIREGVKEGAYQIVVFTPETILCSPLWRDLLTAKVYQDRLVCVAVDEAHCVIKWGAQFRKEFSCIGELRSLIPQGTPLIALTATATVASRNLIILNLGMTNPVVISVSPDKPNIKYHATVKTTVINAFQELLQKLKDHGRTVPRVVIFARTYEHCTMLYRFFKHGLGKDFTFPRGSPDVSKHRLVDMFTNVTEGTVKESIISSMCNDSEILRVLICTVAFGMGLNTEGVREVIHWGVSSDIESYIQETGRGGRDGLPCKAVLYYKNSELHLTTTSQCMIDYCKNVTVCRRKILFKNFDCAGVSSECNGCVCCDICSFQCVCQKCNSYVC